MGDDAHGLAETYRRDGFVFPTDVLDDAEARSIRADLEAAEAELADDPERSALLRSNSNYLLPSFDALVRNEKLLAAASQVLSPDLLVWSADLFIKEAHSPKIVTWHQDLTYWGLDDVAVELQPGQASLHHGHLFHASGPNSTGDRRIGVAIRYIKPSMRQRTGERWMVRLASGSDRYGHFDLVDPPRGRLHEADFERCRYDVEVRRRQFYA